MDQTLTLPFHDPVIVFGITMLVILIVPFIFSKLKLPGIIGLIVSGMLLGSSGFNVLQSGGSIELLGNVGLMYLMFLAGLELDINTFIKNKQGNLLFGFLTFSIPLVIGLLVCRYVLNFDMLQSMLVASMFSTQTLIAYPIVSRLRLTKTKPVVFAIGGTIITDMLVLFLLIVILALKNGDSSTNFWISTVSMVLLYLLFMLYIFPRIVRWFFRNTSTDIMAQYVFVLSMVFLAGILAKLIKLEPIIGAFLAGIVLNKLIPHSSKLMNRVEFVGNAIFIPFFLLYVGMLIDVGAFIAGWNALKLSILLIGIAIFSKWLAAYIIQKLFKFSQIERKLIFGLSTAHAAATIAIILIGFKMGIASGDVLNATVVVIFVSCMVSAIVTEHAGRVIVKNSPPALNRSEERDKILVTISNPATISNLVELSNYLRNRAYKNQVYLLNVVKSDEELERDSTLQKQIDDLSDSFDINLEYSTRIDINISSGIARASKDLRSTMVVMGWNGYFSTKQWIFGSILDGVLRDTDQLVVVSNASFSIGRVNCINVLVQPLSEYEPTFGNWLKAIYNMATQLLAKVNFIMPKGCSQSFQQVLSSFTPTFRFTVEISIDWYDGFNMLVDSSNKCLPVIVSARRGAVSYNQRIDEQIPKYISHKLRHCNFVLLFPAKPRYAVPDSRNLLAGTGEVFEDD